MTSENKSKIFQKRIDDHTALMSEKFEDAFNRTVVLKSLDLVAIEAMRLEIPEWNLMKIGELRAEISRRQKNEKI